MPSPNSKIDLLVIELAVEKIIKKYYEHNYGQSQLWVHTWETRPPPTPPEPTWTPTREERSAERLMLLQREPQLLQVMCLQQPDITTEASARLRWSKKPKVVWNSVTSDQNLVTELTKSGHTFHQRSSSHCLVRRFGQLAKFWAIAGWPKGFTR